MLTWGLLLGREGRLVGLERRDVELLEGFGKSHRAVAGGHCDSLLQDCVLPGAHRVFDRLETPALVYQMGLALHRVGATVAGDHFDDDLSRIVDDHPTAVPPPAFLAVVADLLPVVMVEVDLDVLLPLLRLEEVAELAERPRLEPVAEDQRQEDDPRQTSETDQGHGVHTILQKKVSNLEELR